MSNEEKKPRATRTPRTYEDIERGALSLPLAQKVTLKAALQNSINDEVKEAKRIAEESEKIANG